MEDHRTGSDADAQQTRAARGRVLDTVALKALAHPLRVAILDRLSIHGPATASGLGEELGESSGATSYHLRQLEKHGFVREQEGRGTGRERWWERVPGGLSIPTPSERTEPSMQAASQMVGAEWERRRAAQLEEFIRYGERSMPVERTDDSILTTANLRLTSAQLGEVSRALELALEQIVEPYRHRNAAGSRPVQVHLNLFPLVDGRITAPEDADS